MSPDTVPLPPRAPRPRRRGSGLLALLLLLVLLVGTAALADVVVRARSEASIARQVTDQNQGRGVEVQLDGWPFLWQVGQDRLDGATLRADSLVIDAEGVPLEVVAVELAGSDLVGVRDGQGIVAGQVSGSVGVSWETLGRLSGLDLAHAPPDRVALETSVTVLGREVPLTVEGRPHLEPGGGELGIREATASVAGTTLPQRLVDPVLDRLDAGYRLPSLGALEYRSIAIAPDTVRVGLAGSDVDVDQVLG